MIINYVNIKNAIRTMTSDKYAYVHSMPIRTTSINKNNLEDFAVKSFSLNTVIYAYSEEFKDKIMFDSTNFQLGEINNDITFKIEVYNNSSSAKTINEINIINLNNIDVTVDNFVIQAYKSSYLTVKISSSGESENSGAIQLIIDNQIFNIIVNYSRQAIFSYKIDRSNAISTTYRYNTEIRQSLSGKEFRDAKNDVARMIFDYTYKIDNEKRRKFESDIINNNLSTMYLPIFFQRVDCLLSDLRISGDFRYTNIKVGNSVFALNNGINQILTVTAVTENYIEVEKISDKFLNGYFFVYPLVRTRLNSSITASQVTKNYAKYLLNFDIDEYETEDVLDLNTTFNYETLNNKFFFKDLKRNFGEMNKTFTKKIASFDNNISKRKIFVENKTSRVAFSFTMKLFGREKIAKLKDIFKKTKGAYENFYMVKDDCDLKILETINLNDTIIRVEDANSSVSYENYVFDYIYILYNNNQTAVFKVNEVRKDENNREIILIDASNLTINKESVNFISYVSLCRFNSDDLTISYTTDDVAQATIELITINRV